MNVTCKECKPTYDWNSDDPAVKAGLQPLVQINHRVELCPLHSLTLDLIEEGSLMRRYSIIAAGDNKELRGQMLETIERWDQLLARAREAKNGH